MFLIGVGTLLAATAVVEDKTTRLILYGIALVAVVLFLIRRWRDEERTRGSIAGSIVLSLVITVPTIFLVVGVTRADAPQSGSSQLRV